MKLSIIVPTYSSSKTIDQCLRSVKRSIFKDYELIVVDCGSADDTVLIAKKYADTVFEMKNSPDRRLARAKGFSLAKGEIIVNVDSDILIKEDTLAKIRRYFDEHRNVDALTGTLSKDHPNKDFFSQYKNLYMNYIFRRLPENVNFLYGSIFAIRSSLASLYKPHVKVADDTEFGQELILNNKKIAFLKDLDVIHLKKFSFFSFIKNDFIIPFEWARIFVKYRGWAKMFKESVNFAHSSPAQIISVIYAPTVILCCIILSLFKVKWTYIFLLYAIWFLVNVKFFIYIWKEKGTRFFLSSIVVTFFDNIVMMIGIMCGIIIFFLKPRELNVR